MAEIDKELLRLEAEERSLLHEVKQAAKKGDQAAARLHATHLVRLRGQKERMLKSKAHIRGIGAHAQTAHANLAVASAMKSAGKVMAGVNQQLDPVAAARMAADFQRQSAQLDFAQEVTGDALDSALDFDGIDMEADELTEQVLDELGVETAAKLSSVPAKQVPVPEGSTTASEAELQKRFAALTGR